MPDEPGLLPEVRQCTDPDHYAYGSVAVKANLGNFSWGIFHPSGGGHWVEHDAEVEGWPVMIPTDPSVSPQPEHGIG